jgi:hypothetical protein
MSWIVWFEFQGKPIYYNKDVRWVSSITEASRFHSIDNAQRVQKEINEIFQQGHLEAKTRPIGFMPGQEVDLPDFLKSNN